MWRNLADIHFSLLSISNNGTNCTAHPSHITLRGTQLGTPLTETFTWPWSWTSSQIDANMQRDVLQNKWGRPFKKEKREKKRKKQKNNNNNKGWGTVLPIEKTKRGSWPLIGSWMGEKHLKTLLG